MTIILQKDMEQNKIQALVKVGRQIISMISLEIAGNLHKKRTTPSTELAEEATVVAMVLAVWLLVVAVTFLPLPAATLVLALLYI